MNILYTASHGETATPPPLELFNPFGNVSTPSNNKRHRNSLDMVEESEDEHIQKFSSSEEEDTNGFAGVTFKKSIPLHKQNNKEPSSATKPTNKVTHRKRSAPSPVATKKRKKPSKGGNKKHLSGFTVYFMDMSKKARQKGESTVRSKIINSWRSMSDIEKDKYTQRAKKSNSNKGASASSSSNESDEDDDEDNGNGEEDNDDNEENPPKKSKPSPAVKKEKRVMPKLSVVVPNAHQQSLETEKLQPEQVEYMKYLMQARVRDYVTADQYSQFKHVAANKYDQQEVTILMGLLKQSLQLGDDKGRKKWEKHEGSGFIDSVYKIFQMTDK
jgi:hypothetical protein